MSFEPTSLPVQRHFPSVVPVWAPVSGGVFSLEVPRKDIPVDCSNCQLCSLSLNFCSKWTHTPRIKGERKKTSAHGVFQPQNRVDAFTPRKVPHKGNTEEALKKNEVTPPKPHKSRNTLKPAHHWTIVTTNIISGAKESPHPGEEFFMSLSIKTSQNTAARTALQPAGVPERTHKGLPHSRAYSARLCFGGSRADSSQAFGRTVLRTQISNVRAILERSGQDSKYATTYPANSSTNTKDHTPCYPIPTSANTGNPRGRKPK